LIVYLPDAEKGYYRGTRFDWSGLVARAEFAGHVVYGPFRTKVDPLGHDHVVGPAEEFDMDDPQGWAEARPGETFLKIGVGVLEKGTEERYAFSRPQKVVRPGTWKVTHGSDWVRFEQSLAGDRGWACAYAKRLSLAPDGPGFRLAHTLRNTGTKPIDTIMYNHNFTVIDGDPVGPQYRVAWPFDLAASRSRGRAEIRGRELAFPEVLAKESVWIGFEGKDRPAEENAVTVENRRTGAAVHVRGDQPVAVWRFYAEKTAACPEPFVRIQVAPGEEKAWKWDYTFTAGPKTAPGVSP